MDVVYCQIKISHINFVFLIAMCPYVSSLISFVKYISEPANIVGLGYVVSSVCLLIETVY